MPVLPDRLLRHRGDRMRPGGRYHPCARLPRSRGADRRALEWRTMGPGGRRGSRRRARRRRRHGGSGPSAPRCHRRLRHGRTTRQRSARAPLAQRAHRERGERRLRGGDGGRRPSGVGRAAFDVPQFRLFARRHGGAVGFRRPWIWVRPGRYAAVGWPVPRPPHVSAKGGEVRRIFYLSAAVVVAVAWAASSAVAADVPSTNISITSPFAPGCGGAAEGSVPGANFNYENSEVEPWLAVSPTNPMDVAGIWQQDRWSDGGSHGLVAAVSHDGGATFDTSEQPRFSNCAGGTGDNGGYG